MKLSLVLLLSLFISACSAIATVTNFPLSEEENVGSIRILSSRSLHFPDKNKLAFEGISDLAWDKNKQLLYALTDRAALFHLKIDFKNNEINTVDVIDAYALKDKQGKQLRFWDVDSEGLDIHYNDKQQAILTVSFERYPRIVQYATQGDWIRELPLPKKLKTSKSYRGGNKALESVVIHPLHGVMTAAEYPLETKNIKQQSLYSSLGKEWSFNASPAKNSAVTALEILPNNNILVLERAWAGLAHPLVINLSEVDINNCMEGKICSSKNLAQLSTADQWQLDNFEGLTKLENGQYLMISDDNAKPIQSTVLVLFEVKKQ